MGRIMLLPAVVAFASLAGCVCDYAPPSAFRETTYTYSYAAPPEYYPPPPAPPGGGVMVVYKGDSGWFDDGWPPNGRFKDW